MRGQDKAKVSNDNCVISTPKERFVEGRGEVSGLHNQVVLTRSLVDIPRGNGTVSESGRKSRSLLYGKGSKDHFSDRK